MRDYQAEFDARVAYIRSKLSEAHADGIVFGNSGGKDSALVGILCKAACDNTVGVIDADYFDALNEGHMFVKLYNAGDKPLRLSQGDAFAQGVFLPFGITEDDAADAPRTGGFGSTD